MKIIGVLLCIWLVVSTQVDFETCGSGSVTVGTVDVSPYPPVIGQDVKIAAEGSLVKDISGGSYTLSIKFLGIKVYSTSGDICDLVSCPQSSGGMALNDAVTVPKEAPAGNYEIELSATDKDGAKMFCISITTKLTKASAVHDQDLIDMINTHPTAGWKAAASRRWEGATLDDVKVQCGALEGGPELPEKSFSSTFLEALTVPTSFDSRDEWGDSCSSLNEIRDQGTCGSCWAVAAASAITDRLCIQGKVIKRLSSEDLVSCCGFRCGMGCNGGHPSGAWSYWKRSGLVTGGVYGDHSQCYSYQIQPCSHHVNGSLPACSGESSTPRCRRSCENGATWSNDKHSGSKAYSVSSDVSEIQAEIMQNGPVEAAFTVYADFPSYKSGVYRHVTGSALGGHAVKIIGWGVENNVDYWLIANSWNSEWGDNGFFKIRRGHNECGIESGIVAGMV